MMSAKCIALEARTLRFFLFTMFSPPVTQVVHNSGYSTCLGREVKGNIARRSSVKSCGGGQG